MYVEDGTTPRSESSTSSCQSFLKKEEEKKEESNKAQHTHNTSLYAK